MKILIFSALLITLTFSATINLNSGPQIDLTYSFPSVDTIELTLQFFTQGYIAIGFGTTMANSQIYIASKTASGDFNVVSAHTTGHLPPTPDAVQNLVFVSGTRDSSKTVVTFQRKLNTGNSNDVTITPGSPMDLVWAYGSNDNLQYHVQHGSQSVNFNVQQFLSSF